MSSPIDPKVVELPGLNNPVYSIQEGGDWWRDKSDKRRAWSSLRAAERAMGLTVATRNMKRSQLEVRCAKSAEQMSADAQASCSTTS